jgi:predicted phosphodiesterase
MTRIAVLADIHGNMPALTAVERDMQHYTLDAVVVAGDLINLGPHSLEVAEHIVSRGWPLIRGNHELYLVDYGTPRAAANWDEFPPIPRLQRLFSPAWRARIAAWPDTLCLRFADAPPLRILHGTAQSAIQGIFPTMTDAQIAQELAGLHEQAVVVAHTHLALSRRAGGLHVINPGSVGWPFDGRPGASYAVLEGNGEGWKVNVRRVEYDASALLAAFEQLHFVEECGLIGALLVEECRTHRPRVYPFRRWCEQARPGQPITPALLEEFRYADIWRYITPAYHLNREEPIR